MAHHGPACDGLPLCAEELLFEMPSRERRRCCGAALAAARQRAAEAAAAEERQSSESIEGDTKH